MNIFLDDNSLEEIRPVPVSEDKGIVIDPKKSPGRPTDEQMRSDIIKEIIANDTIELGSRESALIHGVSPASAKSYANGKDIRDPEVRARILDAKHEINNLAITKLMETLNLLQPELIERERDKVSVINGLSQVIERVSGSTEEKQGNKAIHLHLYNPGSSKESDYGDVITVKGT